MSKRNRKAQAEPQAQPIVTAEVTPPVTTEVAIVPPAEVAPPAPPLPRALSLSDVIAELPEGYQVPAYLVAFRDAFRAVAQMPAATREQRIAVRDTFLASVVAAMPGHEVPMGRHTGRFSGMPVFESQNVLYLAAVLANVNLACGHVMAAWRSELPNAKCDYLAKDYAWTTLSEYINHRHNGAVVPGAYGAISAWVGRNRKPVE